MHGWLCAVCMAFMRLRYVWCLHVCCIHRVCALFMCVICVGYVYVWVSVVCTVCGGVSMWYDVVRGR